MKRERDDDESSDDEMGPMPAAPSAVVKKKRKGQYLTRLVGQLVPIPLWSHTPSPVLPHEKVFLEYLPSADQYYKSFMHRDIVNFVVVTRSVSPSTTTPIRP